MSDPRLEALEKVMREAGELALSYFGKVAAEVKPDRTEVTEADRAVERFLTSRLREIDDIEILGEEGSVTASPGVGDPIWAVDPIDGTAVFIAGLPTWSVSVGLIRDGRPELGAVYLPVAGELYIAGSSGPVLRNGVELPGVDPDRTDSFDRRDFICVSSDFHRRFRSRFGGKVRGLGSTAAHLAWTARGAAVATIAYGSLWDFAGGLACCRAAGLEFSYLSGGSVDLHDLADGSITPEAVIVAHPRAIDAIRSAISLR